MKVAVAWILVGLVLVAAGDGDGAPVGGEKKVAELLPGKPPPPVKRGDIRVWPAASEEIRKGVTLPTWTAPVTKPDDDSLVSILVAADQTVYCGGRSVNLPELKKLLIAHAERKRQTDHPMQPSRVPVLIYAAKDVRWLITSLVMQCCALPEVRIYRIYHAMQDDKGNPVYVPNFLPIDRGLGPRRDETPTITVELKRARDEKITRVKLLDQEIGTGDTAFRILRQRVVQILKHNEELPAEVNPWSWVPYGEVMRTFGMFKAAGVTKVTFIGSKLPAPLDGKTSRVMDEPKEIPIPGAAAMGKVANALPPVKRGEIVVWPGHEPAVRKKILLPTWPVAVPAPKEGEFLEVLVTQDGRLFCGGKEIDLRTLTGKFLMHAERARDSLHPMKPNRSVVLFHASRDVRWREMQWVMQAAADPDVRIWRLYLSMRTPDGKFAYVPVFLPIDRSRPEDLTCLNVELKRKKDDTRTRVMFLGQGIGADDTAFLLLRQRLPELEKTRPGKNFGLINAWAWTPYRDVMRALAAFRMAGIETVSFTGAPPPGKKK